ncbi:MAG TPA: MlaD family protein [Kofleriaceae bacterium]|nr:MlaD family protein [Kofleriaceae bacterium]
MPLAVHDERLTRRVGAAVLVAAALTVVFVVMVWPRLGSGGVAVRVRFGVVVGLPAGASVRVAGKDIGHVESIGISRDPRNPRGRTGVVAVLRIDPAWASRIPVNSDFFVDARSMLAPRYIAIGPPGGHADPGRALRDGDEVAGIDPPSLDNVLQRTWGNLEEVRHFLEAIGPATASIKASSGRLAATIDTLDPHPGAQAKMRATVGQVAGTVEAIATELDAASFDPAEIGRLVARVKTLAAKIETTAAELRVQVADVRAALDAIAARTGGRLDARVAAMLDKSDQVLAAAQRLAASVNGAIADATGGRGAIAAFAADLELIDDVKELTKELKRQPWNILGRPAR